MLDLVENEYLELGLPNIKIELKRDWRMKRPKYYENLEVRIAKQIKPLVMEAAVKFPNWEFIGKHVFPYNNDEHPYFETGRFNVYENREIIGTLSSSYNSKHEVVYRLSNDRIEKQRERGSDAITKNLGKAIKIMGKTFGVKKLEERLEEAKNRGEHMLRNILYEKSSRMDRSFDTLKQSFIPYAIANWENSKLDFMRSGADPVVLEKFPEEYEEYRITKEISKCFDQKLNGAVVIIHGNDYAVNEKETTIYGTDNLPAWVKRGVGMLKLVEKNHIIGNVGFKIGDQEFFVVKGENDE